MKPLLHAMARSPVLRSVLLGTIAVVLGVPMPAQAQAPSPAPGTERAEQVEQLWAFVDRRAAELDARWRPSLGGYVTRGGSFSTRMNANITAVHALAAIAGHVGPARRDERIAPMVDALTRAPAFLDFAKRPARATAHFHVPGWTPDAGSYLPLREHVSLDPQAAEGLALAVRARNIVGLPQALVDRVQKAVSSTANSEFYTWPRQKLNQFNWPADMALADARVSGDATLLLRDFPQYLGHFLDHAHRRDGRNRTPNLNDGMGFNYLPNVRPTSPSNRVGTSEYANIVFHALDDYAPALAAGMPPLDEKRMWVLRSWARRILTGDWTHAGYLNWDTGLAYRRWHLSRYWVFALGGLSTLAEAPVLEEREQRWARWMFDRALGYYERLQAGRPQPAVPSTLHGVRSPEADPKSDPQFVAARIAGLVAHQALARAADAPAEQPPPLFAYDPGSRRLAVTTPNYSAAVVDQTIRLGYGGVDLARLYDGRGRPLGSIGSHDRTGFGVAITRKNGRRLLETQGGHRTATRFRSGKPLRGSFTTRTMTATRQGPAPHVRQGPPDVPRRPHRHDLRPARAADVDRPHPLPRLGPPHPRPAPARDLRRPPRPLRPRPAARRRLPRLRAHPQQREHQVARDPPAAALLAGHARRARGAPAPGPPPRGSAGHDRARHALAAPRAAARRPLHLMK